MRNIKPIARRLGSAEGAEIAEAALVLPLVFMLLLGIIWFGRAFNIYSTIAQAAQQGAITAARAGCATCATDFPNSAVVADKVVAVLEASRVDASQIITYQPPVMQGCNAAQPPCQTSQNVTVCRQVLLNQTSVATSQPSECGTLVSFRYRFGYPFTLPFTPLNLQMTAQAQSRMEN